MKLGFPGKMLLRRTSILVILQKSIQRQSLIDFHHLDGGNKILIMEVELGQFVGFALANYPLQIRQCSLMSTFCAGRLLADSTGFPDQCMLNMKYFNRDNQHRVIWISKLLCPSLTVPERTFCRSLL